MAALLEDARRLNTATRERMQQVDSWQARLRAYVTVRMEHLETNQDFLRIYLAEFRGMMMRNARIHCELYQVMRESEGLLAQVFAAAIARGEVRKIDPEFAAMTVVDLTRGLMERRLLGASCSTNPSEIEFALDLLCRSLEKIAVRRTQPTPAPQFALDILPALKEPAILMSDFTSRRFFLGAATAAAATRVWGANDKINVAHRRTRRPRHQSLEYLFASCRTRASRRSATSTRRPAKRRRRRCQRTPARRPKNSKICARRSPTQASRPFPSPPLTTGTRWRPSGR